jgi:nucleoside-diphosphate-sugar epimerase
MIRAIARRRFLLPGDGSTRKSLVHVSTVSDVVASAVASDVSGTFILADRHAPTMRELADTIAREVGRRRPLSVPASLVRAAARSVEHASLLLGKTPKITEDLVRKSMLTSVFSPSRTEANFKVECHVDLGQAIKDEVAWLRASSLL